jgi:hypothetical protein
LAFFKILWYNEIVFDEGLAVRPSARLVAGPGRRRRMATLYENMGMILSVLGLAGLGLVLVGYFGRLRFPYLGGMRTPWDDFDFFVLTEKQQKVCLVIGLLLWVLALFLCVLTSIPGA